MNKSRLDYIEFFLEDDIGNEVDFNGEVLCFTLHLILKKTYKNLLILKTELYTFKLINPTYHFPFDNC